jgi:hypothetical protein
MGRSAVTGNRCWRCFLSRSHPRQVHPEGLRSVSAEQLAPAQVCETEILGLEAGARLGWMACWRSARMPVRNARADDSFAAIGSLVHSR